MSRRIFRLSLSIVYSTVVSWLETSHNSYSCLLNCQKRQQLGRISLFLFVVFTFYVVIYQIFQFMSSNISINAISICHINVYCSNVILDLPYGTTTLIFHVCTFVCHIASGTYLHLYHSNHHHRHILIDQYIAVNLKNWNDHQNKK